VSPEQIAIVEQTLASVDLDALAEDFYRRAFAQDPSLSAMFTSDPSVQRARFAAELREIVHSVRFVDVFVARTGELGRRHRGYGVTAAHYRLMGVALLEAFAEACAEWSPVVEEAWSLAYNLTAEAMMMGAMEGPQG
jgi:hemoglobin-like flavoprotein